jgi:hypothetical protein
LRDVPGESATPDVASRILATAIVATVTAVVVEKLFGRKRSFLAFAAVAVAHDLFTHPLARRLSALRAPSRVDGGLSAQTLRIR